ncbi:MAG: hypothetical protein LBU79_01655, partial [Planctomycetota bacterium]|nr:hypothetical protein [Planctomycetota bacterium]
PHCLVWRRYFQKAVFAFASGHSSYLSNLYIDPVSKKKTHTYVYQLTPERFLFIDLNSRRPGSVIITQPKANTADFSGHNVPHLSFLDSELDDN